MPCWFTKWNGVVKSAPVMRLEHVGHPMVDFFHLKKMDSCNRDPGRLICDPLLQCKWKGEGGASWPYILIKRMLELHSSNTWRIRLFPLVCIGLGLVHDLNVRPPFFFAHARTDKQGKTCENDVGSLIPRAARLRMRVNAFRLSKESLIY